jgi:serine protease Do
MSEIELLSVIERYLNDEMNADERARFEMLCHDNPTVDSRVKEHQDFTSRLKQYGERVEFEGMLNGIHHEIDVQALKDEFVHHPSMIVRIWRNHHSKISVAASITIFAVLSTLFLTGYLKSQDQVSNLINHVKGIESKLKNSRVKVIAPTNYGGIGTGFAISSDGYIATNFHVVNNSDSLYIQSADGTAYHAKVVSTDPASDIAILKITEPGFKSLGTLPYGFRRGKSDLGEELFTMGYPKDDIVYNKGYLSSGNGYKGDTVKYQIGMNVTFGNSGGPVLDSRGNVVAIMSSRQEHVEGTAFAIKSKYLFKAVQADSLDSKINLNSKSVIANLSPSQKAAKVQNYIFMVKVYSH